MAENHQRVVEAVLPVAAVILDPNVADDELIVASKAHLLVRDGFQFASGVIKFRLKVPSALSSAP